ncbi:MAG: hypothetical protein KAG14_01480 [Mycoplasmataceae bacterium]|nr:hypothetical protein [Mycoplasmataceae bacterium]
MFDDMLKLIYKFHGGKVPLTISAIFHFLGLEYNFLNKTLPVGQRAFQKWVSGEYKFFVSKFTNKIKRNIFKKLEKIKIKIEESKKLLKQYLKDEINNKKVEAVDKFIVDEEYFETIKREESRYRKMGKPGVILQ